MKQKLIFLALAAGFVVLLAGATLLYDRFDDMAGDLPSVLQTETAGLTDTVDGTETADTTSAVPEKDTVQAPDFTVYDTDGNAVSLSDYFGTPIVLNFWASWCGPCRSEMPDFHEIYREMGEEIRFLMVNMTGGRETLDSAKAFIADSGYTFPVFYDTDMDAALTYGVYSLPTTYFINSRGEIIAHAKSAIDADLLMQGIAMVRD